MAPPTNEDIADAVVTEGVASRPEVDRITAELYEFASKPNTVLGGPRIIEAWGKRPAA